MKKTIFKTSISLLLTLIIVCFSVVVSSAATTSSAQTGTTSAVVATAKSNSSSVPHIKSTKNTSSGIKLTWDKVKGASKYRVFLKTSSGWKKLSDTKSTSYTYTGAKNNKSYKFTVRCISSDGKKYTSSYDKAGYKATYYTAPKLSSVENTASGVKITWKAVSGIDEYRVYVKRTGSSSWTSKGIVTGTSYTHTSGVSGRNYTYTVRCVKDSKTVSAYKSTKSITYIAAPQVTELENTSSGIKLTWDKVKGASKYRVFLRSGSSWKKLADTKSTSYTYTGVKDNQTYKFTVRCLSSEGKYISAYVKSGFKSTYYAPPTLSKAENTTSGVKVTWKAISGIDTYRLYVKENDDKNWSKVADVSGTTYTDTSVDSGDDCTYTIRCVKDSKTVSAYKSTKSITYVAAPTISDVTLDNDKLVIKWNAVEGAYKYNVLVKDDDGWSSAGYTTKTSYSYSIDGEKTYTFTVKCCDRNNKAVSSYDNNGYSATVTYIIDQEEHTTEECAYKKCARSICNNCGTDISGTIDDIESEYYGWTKVKYHNIVEWCRSAYHVEYFWFYADATTRVSAEDEAYCNNIYLYNETHKDQLGYRYSYNAWCTNTECDKAGLSLLTITTTELNNSIRDELQETIDAHYSECHPSNNEQQGQIWVNTSIWRTEHFPEIGHYELVVK